MARTKARRWQTLKSERVYATPIFDLHRHQRSHPHRGEHDFFVLEAPAWINIIPITPENDVVMVRQFRHGIGDFTLEIPGGMVDPEDPSPLLAARREMREECGYDSEDVVELGRVHPNPAIQPNYCYSFLARNVRRVAAASPGRLGGDGSRDGAARRGEAADRDGKDHARAGDRGVFVFPRLQSAA